MAEKPILFSNSMCYPKGLTAEPIWQNKTKKKCIKLAGPEPF